MFIPGLGCEVVTMDEGAESGRCKEKGRKHHMQHRGVRIDK
jgi:hypothetical protein